MNKKKTATFLLEQLDRIENNNNWHMVLVEFFSSNKYFRS